MATPHRPIRISDDDWDKIDKLAKAAGMSKTAWLLNLAKVAAAAQGVTLSGAAPLGNPKIGDLRRKGMK